MSKLKNIAKVCHLLMNTRYGLSVPALRCRLDNNIHERTIYRYIHQIRDMVPVFGYELVETKRFHKYIYKLRPCPSKSNS